MTNNDSFGIIFSSFGIFFWQPYRKGALQITSLHLIWSQDSLKLFKNSLKLLRNAEKHLLNCNVPQFVNLFELVFLWEISSMSFAFHNPPRSSVFFFIFFKFIIPRNYLWDHNCIVSWQGNLAKSSIPDYIVFCFYV